MMIRVQLSLTFAVVLCCAQPLRPATVTLTSAKDNTLFGDPAGNSSSGAGDAVFAGRTGSTGGGWRLRALVKFDVAGTIPAGSTINSASLTLRLIAEHSNGHTVTVHKALKDWGEGASAGYGGHGAPAEPGDATWTKRFHPDPATNWVTAGGEFVATASASRIVGPGLAFYTWNSTAALVADVQAWLDNPDENYGWLMRGNEATLMTAKKFASREYETIEWRPKLTIDYTPPPPCPADIMPPPSSGGGNGIVDVDDLLVVINNWGATGGGGGSGGADITGDGIVDVDDLLAVINNWGPCA